MGTLAEDMLAHAARAAVAKTPAPRRAPFADANRSAVWSKPVENLLIGLYKQGFTNAEIGARMGKTTNAIAIKLNRLRKAGVIGARPDDE